MQDKEYTQHGLDLGRHGPQFSRSFWALKVWVSLLAHGRQAYARRISHDAALARYMGARAEERPEFELAAPVGLSICCFRYVPPGLPDGDGREAYLNDLNHRLMTEIQLDGRVYISNAILDDRFVLRACIVNFRTEADDVDAVLDVAAELGADARRGDAAGGPGRHGVSAYGLLGSGEFEPWSADVDRRLLADATGDGRVLILPTASAKEGDTIFDGWGSMGLEHFDSLGIPAEVVPLKTREDAGRPEFVAKVTEASVVYFSGGNPAYLAATLAGTPFWAEVLRAQERGLAYIGCSAGVACLGDNAPDSDRERFADGFWEPGLGRVPRDLVRAALGRARGLRARVVRLHRLVGPARRHAVRDRRAHRRGGGRRRLDRDRRRGRARVSRRRVDAPRVRRHVHVRPVALGCAPCRRRPDR